MEMKDDLLIGIQLYRVFHYMAFIVNNKPKMILAFEVNLSIGLRCSLLLTNDYRFAAFISKVQ